MGWYATYKALLNGTGPYGTVKESLVGESDPRRTLDVALDHAIHDLGSNLKLDISRSLKSRISYWARWNGRHIQFFQLKRKGQ